MNLFGPCIKKRVCSALIVGSLLLTSIAPVALAKSPTSPPPPPAKNIIVMISDGCGYNQVNAANLYQHGRIQAQKYEKFPVRFGMSTYSYYGSYDPLQAFKNLDYVKNGATDSAAAATAMSTGIKTYDAAIGVDINKAPLKHVSEQAEELGKATGVVTTVQLSHATPAGFVAHNPSRNDYSGIAREMLLNSATDVIMGAGHPWHDDNGHRKSTPNNYQYVGGQSTWDALFAGTAGADADGDGDNDPWTLIQERGEFQALMNGPTPGRVCGVPQVYTTLQQARSGDDKADPYQVPLNGNVPTLAEMSSGALNVLDNDPDGFFLMIEGGAIDWAGHANQSGRLIEEEIDFNQAVEAVIDWVEKNSNWNETLLIVTGDHETGYLTSSSSQKAWIPLVNNGPGQLPGMQWNSGNHTNSLIPFYAKGRAARHLFRMGDRGNDPVRGYYIDNTAIAKLIFATME